MCNFRTNTRRTEFGWVRKWGVGRGRRRERQRREVSVRRTPRSDPLSCPEQSFCFFPERPCDLDELVDGRNVLRRGSGQYHRREDQRG